MSGQQVLLCVGSGTDDTRRRHVLRANQFARGWSVRCRTALKRHLRMHRAHIRANRARQRMHNHMNHMNQRATPTIRTRTKTKEQNKQKQSAVTVTSAYLQRRACGGHSAQRRKLRRRWRRAEVKAIVLCAGRTVPVGEVQQKAVVNVLVHTQRVSGVGPLHTICTQEVPAPHPIHTSPESNSNSMNELNERMNEGVSEGYAYRSALCTRPPNGAVDLRQLLIVSSGER
jgi:hypothetical protein